MCEEQRHRILIPAYMDVPTAMQAQLSQAFAIRGGMRRIRLPSSVGFKSIHHKHPWSNKVNPVNLLFDMRKNNRM